MNKSYFRNVINESYVQPKVLKEDSEERAWEYRQIQDAAKKAKAMKKKGQKVNFSQLADDFGVSAEDIKKACNESLVTEAKGKPYEIWKTNPAFRAIHIDLYTGKPKELMAVVEKIEPWLEYTRPSMSKDGKIVTYKGEEYMIVITGNR